MRAIVLVLLLLTGCTIVSRGPSFDHDDARSIAVGTIVDELLETMGEPPEVLLQDDDGSEKWLYTYQRGFGISVVLASSLHTYTRSAVYDVRDGVIERLGTMPGPLSQEQREAKQKAAERQAARRERTARGAFY